MIRGGGDDAAGAFDVATDGQDGYNGYMSLIVGARDLKNRLGSYLRIAREGTPVIVTDRGQPVVELRALEPVGTDLDSRLRRLAAEGLVTLRTLDRLPPRVRIEAAMLSQAVIEDRADRL